MAEIRFRLLGVVEIWDGERWRNVVPAKSRQVLTLLLSAPGQVVLMDQIVSAVWGEAVPQTPAGLVRNYVMKLRRVLAGGAEIVTRFGGYQLDIDPATVDAVCFERALHQARQAAEPAMAQKLLEEALAYWRGPALADARQSLVLALEAARLEDLRTAARQLRAELVVDRGSCGEAVSELRSLLNANPDWERLCELTMVALTRDGRAAEALDVYAQFQEHHRNELGLDPGPRIAALHQAVLRGEAESWEISTRRLLNGN